jgi:hypothetical protein
LQAPTNTAKVRNKLETALQLATTKQSALLLHQSSQQTALLAAG